MSKLDFSYGSTVYYHNEAYRVIAADGLKKVVIKHIEDENVISVNITELSSTPNQSNNPLESLDNYTEEEWEAAKKRFAIIKPLLQVKRSVPEVKKIASEHNVGIATLYRWIEQYESNPVLSSLVPQTKQRGPKEKFLPDKTNRIIAEILEHYYLQKQRPSFKRTYIKVKKACQENNTPIPSENTLRNRIYEIDPKYLMKKRKSYKEAMEYYGDFPGEFKDGNYPLDVFQIDHTPLDVILVDDIRREPVGRPILTIATDIYSRMVAGFYLSFQGPAYFNVGQCLYRCFLPKERYLRQIDVEGEWPIYGTPRVIHVDNGAELVGTEVQRVCDEYGISIEKRPPGRPQYGGTVERLIGTINSEIHNLPGSTNSSPKKRGSYNSEKEASLTIDELERWLAEYIVNVYHSTIHEGIETTPLQRYRFGIEEDENNPQVGTLPSLIEDEEQIKISLLPTFFRTVQRNGITLDDITYYADTLRQFIKRKGDDGKPLKLKIKRDPRDISKIYVYDPKLESYLVVPYARIYAPAMNIWELKAIKRYLRDNKIKHYDESDIFRAYEKLEAIEADAKKATRGLRRKTKPTPKPDTEKSSKKLETASTPRRGFGNIKIFDVVEYSKDEDES